MQAVWCHEVGGARMLHALSITQRYPGHAVQAAHVAAQCGASAYASKYIVVVDDDVDVTNLDHLLWAMLTRTDPKDRSSSSPARGISSADPALPPERRAVGNMTHSVALIDACKPHWRDKFPPTNAPSAEVTAAREKFGWLLDGNGAWTISAALARDEGRRGTPVRRPVGQRRCPIRCIEISKGAV